MNIPSIDELEQVKGFDPLLEVWLNASGLQRKLGQVIDRARERLMDEVAGMSDYAREQTEKRLQRIGVPFPSDPDN